MTLRCGCFVGNDRRCFTSCVLLLSNGYRGSDILDMFQHKYWVLFRILQLLEKEERLFIIAQAALYSVTCNLFSFQMFFQGIGRLPGEP